MDAFELFLGNFLIKAAKKNFPKISLDTSIRPLKVDWGWGLWAGFPRANAYSAFLGQQWPFLNGPSQA